MNLCKNNLKAILLYVFYADMYKKHTINNNNKNNILTFSYPQATTIKPLVIHNKNKIDCFLIYIQKGRK